MNARVIDPLGSARIDDVRDPYRVERVRAQMRADRVERAQAPQFARIPAARPPAASTAAEVQRPATVRKDEAGGSVNPLRDQYTAHCLKNAVQAFHDQQVRWAAQAVAANRALQDEQALQRARAEAANDLGTIQGLLPLQPYRFAAGLAPLLPQAMAAAASVPQAAVGPVAQAAPLRNATDDAFSTDAHTRDRMRRPRKTGA